MLFRPPQAVLTTATTKLCCWVTESNYVDRRRFCDRKNKKTRSKDDIICRTAFVDPEESQQKQNTNSSSSSPKNSPTDKKKKKNNKLHALPVTFAATMENLAAKELKLDTPKLTKSWLYRFNEATELYINRGHLTITKEDDNVQLARWITYQRKLYRQNDLTPERYEALNHLETFKDSKNDIVLAKWKREKLAPALRKDGSVDAKFIKYQRRLMRAGKLSREKINELNRHGVDMRKQKQRPKQSWEKTLQELILFKEIKGNCDAQEFKKALPVKLKRWLNDQKRSNNEEKKNILREHGFGEFLINKNPRVSWETRFAELHEFKSEHGHCNVPVSYRLNR